MIAGIKRYGDGELPKVAGTGRAPAGFLGATQGREKQGGKDPDDGDDHQQFDQREGAATSHGAQIPE